MTVEEITDGLKDVQSWQNATSLQRGSFALEMKDRNYGRGPLTAAWLWFLSGWRQAINQAI